MPAYIEPSKRFLKYAEMSGGTDACWTWTGGRNAKGYGVCKATVFGHRVVSAHRFSWVLHGNALPKEGMVLDHICDNKACVNPRHLRPLDNTTNVMIGNGACAVHARQTHCVRGHRLSGDNLLLDNKAYRQCRLCFRSAQKKYATKVRLGLTNEHMDVLECVAASSWFREALK